MKPKQYEIPLEAGKFYHLYNRGTNGCNLFYEERNYDYFLEKYALHTSEVVDTYAYCLLGNHFHLLVRVKDNLTNLPDFDIDSPETKGLYNPDRIVSRKFANLFNSYSKSINKAKGRTGKLFETPFKRIPVEDDSYFTHLIWYIHSNAQKHGLIPDFKDYPHSSYHSFLANQTTRLAKTAVLDWFGGKEGYLAFHQKKQEESKFKHLIIEF